MNELLEILGIDEISETELENEMITAPDLAASALVSPQEMKNRASTIRRAVGSLKTEISAAKWTELTAREIKLLSDAQDLLNLLASRYAGAGEQQRKGLDAREMRKRAVMKAIQGNFGQLQGDDLLCLVWSVCPGGMKRFVLDGTVSDMDDPVDTVAFKCAHGAKDEAAALVKAADMWERFGKERGRWLVEARAKVEKIRAGAV